MGTGVDDVELTELLHNAGLSELLRRVGGLDLPVNWNWYVRHFHIIDNMHSC